MLGRGWGEVLDKHSPCYHTVFQSLKYKRCAGAMFFVFSLNHDLELCSSSFTFGSVSELSLRSLNHDLAAILDVDTLGRRLGTETAAAQVVPDIREVRGER